MLVPVFPAAQMRPKEPPTFKGDLNEDIDAWYSLVQDYCHLMGTSEAQNVAYMATLLQGAARVFWDSILRASGGRRPTSMMEFITILRQRFLSPMHERQARVTLWSIGQRQAESVHAFSCRFQNLLQRLATYDATDILERYIRALCPELRLAVVQKDPRHYRRPFTTPSILSCSRSPMAHDRHRGVHRNRSQQVISRSRATKVSPTARRSNENVEEDQCWSAQVVGGSVDGQDAARVLSLSNRPSRRTRPVPGMTPPGCGTRPLVQCTGRWRNGKECATVTGGKVVHSGVRAQPGPSNVIGLRAQHDCTS